MYNNIFDSDWDIGVCLRYECRRKQLQVPPQMSSWVDLRATYRVRNCMAGIIEGLKGSIDPPPGRPKGPFFMPRFFLEIKIPYFSS